MHNFTELSTGKFIDQQISLSTLPLLTDGDLKDLGINKMGDRKRFMFAAKEWLSSMDDRSQRGRERERKEQPSRTSSHLPVSPSPSPSQRTGDELDVDGGISHMGPLSVATARRRYSSRLLSSGRQRRCVWTLLRTTLTSPELSLPHSGLSSQWRSQGLRPLRLPAVYAAAAQ